MTLRETLEKIRSDTPDDGKFEAIVEGMRRRANKGMIPGVSSSKDIDVCLSEMEKETAVPNIIIEKENLIAMISEVDNACKKYGYLAEDYEIDDETMENVALYEFYQVIDEAYGETFRDKWHDYKNSVRDWAEENPGKAAKAGAGIGAAAGIAATSPFLIDTAKRHALRSNYIDTALRNGSSLSSKELAAEFNAANPSLIKKMATATGKGITNAKTWFAAHPKIGYGLAGAGLLAAGSLLAYAIRRARRKREAMLKESTTNPIIFSSKSLSEGKEILDYIPEKLLESILNRSNELVQEFIFEAYEFSGNILENETLTEAVTYINNCGELKTKSAKEYVEDMHKYEGRESIKKYDKKSLKKRDYKLLDEDLDSFKKLSEMSLEEILAEAESI